MHTITKLFLGTVASAICAGVGLLGTAFIQAQRPKLEVVSLPEGARFSRRLSTRDGLARFLRRRTGWPMITEKEFLKLVGTRTPGELRLLVLSDLHLTDSRAWEKRTIARLSALDYDLLVLTGDNFADETGLKALVSSLSTHAELSRAGVYVYGSNDFFSGKFRFPLHYFFPSLKKSLPKQPDLPTTEFSAWLKAQGWRSLNNANSLVSLDIPTVDGGIRAVKIAVSGVLDPHLKLDQLPSQAAEWERADYRLALTHAPYRRVLDAYSARRADLILAGHTHGGQICLPGSRSLVNNCDIDLEFSHGLHDWGDSKLYVSRGLGTSKHFPLRLFCRPEVTLVKLKMF